MMKSSRDTPATEAMKAFCGFPKMVAALPIFAEVAIPRQSGRSSHLFLPFLTNSDSSKGVMIRHVAQFVMNADITAERRQIFQRMVRNGLLSPLIHNEANLRIPSRSK